MVISNKMPDFQNLAMIQQLRISVSSKEPWFREFPANRCGGILCNLLNYLATSLKFNYSLTRVAENMGIEGAGQQWNGIIGCLQRKVIKFLV